MRAFDNKRYDYYRLTRAIGLEKGKGYLLPAGTIFVHDKDDSDLGSIADGCLKLCWTPDGSCYGNLCGETVIFHSAFKRTDMFELVQSASDFEKEEKLESLIQELEKQLQSAKDQLREIRQ